MQWPSTSVCGLATAASIRSVICAFVARSSECTLATTTSSRLSSSSVWSRLPSGLMSHSMPVRIRNGASSSFSWATTSSWRSSRSALNPLATVSRGEWSVSARYSCPIREMAEAAIAIGHEYMALTDHSPRLTVANCLSPARLEEQLDVVAALNEELAPFRILTGIECDINVYGSLDQTD